MRGVAGGGDEAAAGPGHLPAAAGGAGLPRGGEHAGEGGSGPRGAEGWARRVGKRAAHARCAAVPQGPAPS